VRYEQEGPGPYYARQGFWWAADGGGEYLEPTTGEYLQPGKNAAEAAVGQPGGAHVL